MEILKGLLEKSSQGQSCGQKWAVGPVDTGADGSPAILSCSQVRPGTAPAPRCQAFLAAAWGVAWSLGLGRDTEGPEGWHHLEIKAGAVDWTPQSGTEEGLEVPRSWEWGRTLNLLFTPLRRLSNRGLEDSRLHLSLQPAGFGPDRLASRLCSQTQVNTCTSKFNSSSGSRRSTASDCKFFLQTGHERLPQE